LIFFVDRNLGKIKFPGILEAAGVRVERHDAHFGQDATDEEWLSEIAARGWIAITRDRRIRYKPNELQAVIDHDVAMLVLIGEAAIPELAHSFVATLGAIERFVKDRPAPYIGKVYRATETERARRSDAPGRVELWFPAS